MITESIRRSECEKKELRTFPAWAGELPLRITSGPPVEDPELSAVFSLPTYVMQYSRFEQNTKELK